MKAAHVIAEVYPGAHEQIETYAEAHGGWVCEMHPEQSWPHDDCPGPGMVRDDNRGS